MEFIKFRYDAGSGVENATPADHGGLHAREHLEQSSILNSHLFAANRTFSLPNQNGTQ
jgi:hypothetical protein